MNLDKTNTNPFSIGDTVYVIGKYYPLAPFVLITATISHIEHRQFVAYGKGSNGGTWCFSKKDYNKCVFTDKEQATRAFKLVKEGTDK